MTVMALWPSQYPYRQAPKVPSQRQAEYGVTGENAARDTLPSQVNSSRDEKSDHRGENAAEISVLGIKPGEWLLSIITLMLWGATVGLVRGGDKTAERQLRAYVSVESGAMFRQSRKTGLRFEFRPNVVNNGQTPAQDVKITSFLRITEPKIPEGLDYRLPITPGSVSTIGPRQARFHSAIASRRLTIAELRQIQIGTHVFHVFGSVTYRDIFNEPRATNFSFVIYPGKNTRSAVWHHTAQNNDAD
jgi:hypothetical protein